MVRVRGVPSGTGGVIGHTGDDRVGGGSSPSESAVQWSGVGVRYRNLRPFDSVIMGENPQYVASTSGFEPRSHPLTTGEDSELHLGNPSADRDESRATDTHLAASRVGLPCATGDGRADSVAARPRAGDFTKWERDA